MIDEHLEAIMLFVRWASYQELASQESADPDPESMAISILERCTQRPRALYPAPLHAYRAERVYRNTIEDYQKMAGRSAIAV